MSERNERENPISWYLIWYIVLVKLIRAQDYENGWHFGLHHKIFWYFWINLFLTASNILVVTRSLPGWELILETNLPSLLRDLCCVLAGLQGLTSRGQWGIKRRQTTPAQRSWDRMDWALWWRNHSAGEAHRIYYIHQNREAGLLQITVKHGGSRFN